MHYAILVQESAADFAERTDPATSAAYMGAYFAYSQALAQAGVMRGGAGLHAPATATTIRVRDGKRLVQDGPFAETKEQIGGFFLIETPDLDAALNWAAPCPAASRAGVEVRPTLPPPPDAAA
jgi:hypothetical protein